MSEWVLAGLFQVSVLWAILDKVQGHPACMFWWAVAGAVGSFVALCIEIEA